MTATATPTRTTIREAIAADIPALVAMGQRFLHGTPYRDLIADSPEHMAKIGHLLVTSPDGVMLVAERDGIPVGMIGVLICPHHLSGERIANEVFWWVDEEARGQGVRLLRAAEQWVKAQGVTAMQMVAPNDRVGKLYERFGYTAIEVAYRRSLA